MAKVTMTLHGFEAVQRAIKHSPDLVRAHASDAIAATAFAIAGRAKATVKKDTGRLQRAITTSARGLSGRVLIQPEGFYWRFLEYGTVKMPASPFIRPAVEAETPIYLQRIQGVGKKIEQAFTKGSRFG